MNELDLISCSNIALAFLFWIIFSFSFHFPLVPGNRFLKILFNIMHNFALLLFIYAESNNFGLELDELMQALTRDINFSWSGLYVY